MSKKPKKALEPSALPQVSSEPFADADLLDVLEAATAFGHGEAISLLNRRADAIAARRTQEEGSAYALALKAAERQRERLARAAAWAGGALALAIAAIVLIPLARADLNERHAEEGRELAATLAQGFFKLDHREQWPASVGGARLVSIAPEMNFLNSPVGSTVVFNLGAKRAGEPLKVVYSRFDENKAPVETELIDLTDRSGTASVSTSIGGGAEGWLRMEASR